MTYVGPDGKRRRASTGEHYYEKAKAVRDRHAGDVAAGRPVAPPRKVTLHDLKDLIEADYKTKGNRSLRRLKGALKPVLKFFGRRPAASISWGRHAEISRMAKGPGRRASHDQSGARGAPAHMSARREGRQAIPQCRWWWRRRIQSRRAERS